MLNQGKFGTKSNNAPQGNKNVPQTSDWRRKHEELIAAVRLAKAYDRAVKTGAPLPPPGPAAENPDYVECPTCARRFNETAAARHIPFCAEQSNRVTTHKVPDANAKMRANARSYVAPTPGSKGKGTSGGDYESGASTPSHQPPPYEAKRVGPSGGNANVDHDSRPVGGGGSKPVASEAGANHAAPASESTAGFCHECGAKYPSKTAKFCTDCGEKRL